MKNLLPVIILCLVGTAFGQITIDQLQAKAKDSKLKDVSFTYDKYKDLSRIITKPYNLVGSWEGAGMIMAGNGARGSTVLTVSAGLLMKGNRLDATPDKAVLIFSSMSKNWVFLKGDKNLYILYDDKRLELPLADQDGDIRHGWGNDDTPIQELLVYEISLSDLKAIASARNVSAKLGERPRQFKSELLERFQKFIDLVTIK